MLSRIQIIDAIQQLNNSARKEWLDAFDTSNLRTYLNRLQLTIEPRGGCSIWVRPQITRALMTRRPRS